MPDINLDNIELISTVSRYVVPFYFSYDDNGYSKITDFFRSNKQSDSEHILPKGKWVEQSFWDKYKPGMVPPEMDVYAYLLNVYKNDEEDSNIGTSFIYETDDSESGFFSYIDNSSLEVSCTDLGLILYKTGVGFVWYEVSFASAYDNQMPGLQKFINYQSMFKELSRATGYINSQSDINGESGKKRSMFLGEWVKEVISANDNNIRFWEERVVKGRDKCDTTVPNTALLFQYAFINDSEDNVASRDTIAFWLGNGFSQKFSAPRDFSDIIYKPFGNASFYISKGGMSYVVSNSETDNHFFSKVFPRKFRGDYFFIYTLLIYQSYSCSQYSRLLSKKLPANKEIYLKDDSYAELLGDLDYQIQIFLVKSIYESVSNIQHQNGVYKYGENMLHINEEIASLQLGLSSLRELVTQKQDAVKAEEERKEMELKESKETATNYALTIFGLLAFFSVMTDSLSTVDRILQLDSQDPLNLAHYVAIVLIVALAAFTIIRLVKNHPKRNKKKK